MYDYELVAIISPELDEEGVTGIMDEVGKRVTDRGGVINETHKWGKRKLAYPIKHVLEGNYVLVKFKLDPSANKELETNLKIAEKIIRYLLIKTD